jgi:hypothetical protein
MILDYINRNKFNINKDYEEYQKKDLVYKYKVALLKANGHHALAEKLYNTAPRFNEIELEENEHFEKNDFDVLDDSVYPISLSEEKNEIEKRVRNLEYLEKSYKIFEYCRTRCKISKMQNKNLVAYPQENQMCLVDCLNIRYEKFGPEKPSSNNDSEGSPKENADKTFIWLA